MGHLWSLSITQGSVHRDPQNHWDSYHFPPRSEEANAEHGQGSCYTRSHHCFCLEVACPSRTEAGLPGYRALRPQGKHLSFYVECVHVSRMKPGTHNDSGRKCQRKMSHLLLSTEAGSAAYLLQRGVRVAQPGARCGVGGVAMCQHLLLCGNKTTFNSLRLRDLQL